MEVIGIIIVPSKVQYTKTKTNVFYLRIVTTIYFRANN